MKLIPLTLISMAMTVTAQAQTGNVADETAIRQLVQTFEDGWTKKDGALFAKPFAEDADYVVINGMYIKGRKAIAAGHQSIFDTFYKETFIKATVKSVRFIRNEVAIVHVAGQMTGSSNGKTVDTKSLMTLTVEKSASGWQIVAFQNTQQQVPAN